MTWDPTSPAGTDPISNGDDSIRTFKTDLQTSLRGNVAEGTEAIFPGSDTANPVFRYRGLKGATGALPASGQYGLYFDSTRNVLRRDNGSTWEDVGTVIPANSYLIFWQASTPTGFTRDTTSNDAALRVVSGTAGGVGGSTGFSSAFSGAHTHTLATHGSTVAGQNLSLFAGYDTGGGTGNQLRIPDGTAGASTIQPVDYATAAATVTFSPKYIDCLVAFKT